MIKVTIWNEFLHETSDGPQGDLIRGIYPRGIHVALQEHLSADDLEIRTACLKQPGHGLSDELLYDTDVLLWWGHCAHAQVPDDLVDKIQARVYAGMGLIVLHSAHYSKIFRRLMGGGCTLNWRVAGEKERLWCVCPGHPIAQGVPETFVVPQSEMYGEPFAIPDDGKIVFLSWYEGGNVFRSGVTFQRGNGKIFYFAPGHETYPIYHNSDIIKVIGNAIRWAAPASFVTMGNACIAIPYEKISKVSGGE